MEEFKYVIEAFKEEPSIEELNNMKGWNNENSKNFISKGICAHLTVNEEQSIKLQFFGWELVLLKNGKYFINDTSGG